MNLNKLFFAVFITWFFLATASFAEPNLEPVRAKLVVDPTETSAGGLLLGVKFMIDPDWHVYWQNPGGIGLPTQVKFLMPEGGTVGPLLWPIPEQFQQSDGGVGYGYTKEAVIMSEITLPTVKEGVELGVDVRWIGCSKSLCVPGKYKFKMPVESIGHDEASAVEDLTAWRNAVPRTLKAAGATFSVNQNSDPEKISIEMVINWKEPPGEISLFPKIERHYFLSAPTVTSDDEQTVIGFNLEPASIKSKKLDAFGLVIVSDVAGKRLAYEEELKLQ